MSVSLLWTGLSSVGFYFKIMQLSQTVVVELNSDIYWLYTHPLTSGPRPEHIPNYHSGKEIGKYISSIGCRSCNKFVSCQHVAQCVGVSCPGIMVPMGQCVFLGGRGASHIYYGGGGVLSQMCYLGVHLCMRGGGHSCIINLAKRGYCNAGVRACVRAGGCAGVCAYVSVCPQPYITHHNFVKCGPITWKYDICIFEKYQGYRSKVKAKVTKIMKITVSAITIEPDVV